jgi:hypothetical protein
MKPWEKPLIGKSWPLHHRMLTDKDLDPAATPDEWVVDRIMKHRRRPDGQMEVLTRWQGYTSEDYTWELAPQFLPRYNSDWVTYCKKHKLAIPFQQLFQESR